MPLSDLFAPVPMASGPAALARLSGRQIFCRITVSGGAPAMDQAPPTSSHTPISVILPVLNEEAGLSETLQALRRLAPDEIVVVDGGSVDRTRDIAEREGALLVRSPAGRARQMNQGAGSASGEILLFLHADTRLPPTALTDIRSALADDRCPGGRFDVALDGEGAIFKLIGALISLRSRWTKVATGDQAIFARRSVFEEIGGFPDIPIMEDIAFSRALKKKGRVACLRSRVVTSARRWEAEGVWRTIFKMWLLRVLFLIGVPPSRLKRFYADAR